MVKERKGMKLILLGSGDANRVPSLGCRCENCEKARRDDKLRRSCSSLLIIKNGKEILFDIGPDIREQLIREEINNIDAVFLTHQDSDHFFGIEYLRCLKYPLKPQAGKTTPIFAPSDAIDRVQEVFFYMIENREISVKRIKPGERTNIQGLSIISFPVSHRSYCSTFGYIIQEGNKKAVYLPDVKSLSKSKSILECKIPEIIRNPDLIFIDANGDEPSDSHISWKEAVRFGKKIKADKIILIHLSHAANPKVNDDQVIIGFDGYSKEL